MSLITLDTLVRSRWKNGLGDKATIVSGDGWSLSHAWIDGDAPFSDFSGMDRSCVLISGGGLTLSCEGEPATDLPSHGTLHNFPGDSRVHARLHDGACHVLSVMTDRARYEHRVQVLPQLPTIGYAVVLTGTLTCGGQIARRGDTVALPYAAEGSPDLLVVAVEVSTVHAAEGQPCGELT